MRTDDRAAAQAAVNVASIGDLDLALRPRLLPLHALLDDATLGAPDAGAETAYASVPLPAELPLSQEHLSTHGVYLLDNGDVFLIRVGLAAPPEFMHTVLERDAVTHQYRLRTPDGDEAVAMPPSLCVRVHNVLTYLRAFSSTYQRVNVILEVRPVGAKTCRYSRLRPCVYC